MHLLRVAGPLFPYSRQRVLVSKSCGLLFSYLAGNLSEYEKNEEPQERNKVFRTNCLQRDNFQCVVSKALDLGKWEEQGEPDILFGSLDAAHIIPWSFASFDVVRNSRNNKTENGLTLDENIHTPFGRFNCVFQPILH